jgi:hydrogenase maturation protease
VTATTPTCGVPAVLVLCLGSELMGDDGAGLEVGRRLRDLIDLDRSHGSVPLRVEEAATDVLRLLDLWCGESHVWLVDALASGSPAGNVVVIEHDDVLSLPQRHATAHYLSVPESLRWLVLSRPEFGRVRYRLWGIEVAGVAPRLGLSVPVEAAVDQVVQRVLEEARALFVARTESGQPSGRR